jgi:hypothetical protein
MKQGMLRRKVKEVLDRLIYLQFLLECITPIQESRTSRIVYWKSQLDSTEKQLDSTEKQLAQIDKKIFDHTEELLQLDETLDNLHKKQMDQETRVMKIHEIISQNASIEKIVDTLYQKKSRLEHERCNLIAESKRVRKILANIEEYETSERGQSWEESAKTLVEKTKHALEEAHQQLSLVEISDDSEQNEKLVSLSDELTVLYGEQSSLFRRWHNLAVLTSLVDHSAYEEYAEKRSKYVEKRPQRRVFSPSYCYYVCPPL